ncbi:MAG: hypothetical protein KGJ30_06200 [Burkholderiales bacterium]|nr:hypothetical protein [Burkholderiales bacterium]
MHRDQPSEVESNRRPHEQRQRIEHALSSFTVPMLLRTYHAFDGDLIAAIVLGEIGLRNIGAWLANNGNDAAALQDRSRHADVLRPCNALSIADATGLPRETVRRKVARLTEQGLVYRGDHGHLYVQAHIAQCYAYLNRETLDALRVACARIEELLMRP